MSTLLVQSGTFDDIADAIRAKTGKVASMTPLEMPQEIASISGGGVTESFIYNVDKCAFNTGHKHTANTKIKFKARITPTGDLYQALCGSRKTNYQNNCMAFSGYFSGRRRYCYARTGNEATTDSNLNYDDVMIFTLEGQTASWEKADGTGSTYTLTSSGTVDGGYNPMAIFCLNQSSTEDGFTDADHSSMWLYWFEIYENNVLVHRFVPAKNNNQVCLYDEIEEEYIYDVKNNGAYLRIVEVQGGGGITILSGTTEPTSSQGADGQIYLKCGENGVDLSTFTFRNTGGVTCVSSKYALIYTYNSGSSIGAESRLQMDLTDVNELKFTLSKFHKNYDNSRTIKVYIENTLDPASNWISSSSLIPDAEISTNDTTNTYTVDVSSYTGNYWIVVTSHGVSGEFRDLVIDGNIVEKYILNSFLKVNGTWQELIGSDIDDVNLGS